MKMMTVAIAALVLGSVGCTSAKSTREVVAARPVEAPRPTQLGRSFDFEPVTIVGQAPGRSFHFEPVTIVVKPGSHDELALGR